jgi:hypothetical protein
MKLPKYDEIKADILNNVSHVKAFKMAYFDDVVNGREATAQQDTIKKIAANGASSPGALSGGEPQTTYTADQLNKMTTEDIRKNYDSVMKSLKQNLKG